MGQERDVWNLLFYSGLEIHPNLEGQMRCANIWPSWEEAWGLTEPDGSKITIARAATRSHIKLYMTTRHELYHSYFIRGDLSGTIYSQYQNIGNDIDLQHKIIYEDFERPYIFQNISKRVYDSIFWPHVGN